MKSWIEISAPNLRANLAAVRKVLGSSFEPLCVIKADAYGHGAALCARVLAKAGAHWFGVSDLEEGVRVREALKDLVPPSREIHVLVMSGFEAEDVPGIIAHQLTPIVWTARHIRQLEAVCRQTGQRLPVHIELETGMARQGATGSELAALLIELQTAPHLRVEGVFSHLSSSEIAGSPVTADQLQRFHTAFAQLLNALLPEYVHLGNTSALDEHSTLNWLRSATAQLGTSLLARPGLGIYGYALRLEGASDAQSHLRPTLLPVASWRTHIIDLRWVAPGDTVGYGASFVAERPMRLALLPVGYADGFRREASSGIGNGWVMVEEQRAGVVGRVSMNLILVDVTEHDPQPAVGDQVILLGEGVTAEDHAAWCGTIPYEILCGMRGHKLLME